jgi:hypothetical protein
MVATRLESIWCQSKVCVEIYIHASIHLHDAKLSHSSGVYLKEMNE